MLTLFKNSLFDDFNDLFIPYRSSYEPKIDVRKDENEYKVIFSVPGLTKDDLKIITKDRMITISYKKEEKNDNSYFVESFSKSFSLPDDIKEDEIEGKVENGLLELKLPFTLKKPLQRLIELK